MVAPLRTAAVDVSFPYTFNQAGDYTVTLTVTDRDNNNYSALAAQLGIKLIHVYDNLVNVPEDIFKEMSTARNGVSNTVERINKRFP